LGIGEAIEVHKTKGNNFNHGVHYEKSSYSDVEAEVEIKPQEIDSISDRYTLNGYTLFLHGLCSKCCLDKGEA